MRRKWLLPRLSFTVIAILMLFIVIAILLFTIMCCSPQTVNGRMAMTANNRCGEQQMMVNSRQAGR